MHDEDRIFLREFTSKTCLTHPAIALALHRSAVDADEVGVIVESLMNVVERSQAAAVAERARTGALVQTYVVARLLAQLAAAVEDCASLGHAIRFRDRGGLFARYLNSMGGAAGDFFDEVRQGRSLPELLAIPELDTLAVEGEDGDFLAHDYASLPGTLRQIADFYREAAAPLTWPDIGVSDVDREPDVVKIVIDLVPIGSPVPPVTLLEAYNKIKHRFAVFDEIATLGAAARATDKSVVFATYPRHPDHAERLVLNTVAVAQASGEMAALPLKLDELGVA